MRKDERKTRGGKIEEGAVTGRPRLVEASTEQLETLCHCLPHVPTPTRRNTHTDSCYYGYFLCRQKVAKWEESLPSYFAPQ